MNLAMIAAVLAGSMVVFGYLVVIWWLDRYEREPFWLTLLVFAWGAFGGTSMGCLCSLPCVLGAAAAAGDAAGQVFGAVVVAPVVEELTKGLVFIALLMTRHLDNETDGLIYGAAAGLGFAAVENVVYAIGAAEMGTGAVVLLMFVRTLFCAFVHCISSGILGMTIGYACHRAGPARWIVWPAIGLVLAISNHALWNALATAVDFEVMGEASPLLTVLAMLIVVAAGAGMFALTQFSLHREHQVIRRHSSPSRRSACSLRSMRQSSRTGRSAGSGGGLRRMCLASRTCAPPRCWRSGITSLRWRAGSGASGTSRKSRRFARRLRATFAAHERG
jgi:RsiW-degrading membrane proteinase PrsW (M82 family)